MKTALIIGNSDGIGLAITKALLKQRWNIIGVSRSPSVIKAENYESYVCEVQKDEYIKTLNLILEKSESIDLCIYCVGIGELLEIETFENEELIFKVNLLGLVRTVSVVLPQMVKAGSGHFIGLSSVADEMLSDEAPAYHASKAGFSSYLEGLALALRLKGVNITNVRFGFVDTKMAKGDVKPFMITVEQAKEHLLKCIDKRPIRYSAPKIIIPLVKFRSWMLRLKI